MSNTTKKLIRAFKNRRKESFDEKETLLRKLKRYRIGMGSKELRKSIIELFS